MAIYRSGTLPDMEGMDDKKERRQILNYLSMLDEKLRYMFQNIEPEENFGGAAFQNYIKTENSVTSLQLREGEISALITDMQGNFSLLEQRVDGISLTVADAENNISRIEQEAEAIRSSVANAEGAISRVEQKADGISAAVTSVAGEVSRVEQKADGISATVTSVAGEVSRVEQKADGISATVAGVAGEVSDLEWAISVVEQEADKISWIVESGTSASRFTLTDRMMTLIADEIDVYGVVTFNDLSRSGRTDINGDNITTGEISANYIHLGGLMEVYRTATSGTMGGYIGYGSGNNGSTNTKGIMISDSSEYSYFIATSSGVRMTYDEVYAVYCTSKGVTLVGDYDFRAATNFFPLDSFASLGSSAYPWDTVFAETGSIQTSDRRAKNSIGYDMEVYEALFTRLKPTQYKMNNGKSGRLHLGFIAQDVEESMAEIGMGSEVFAGFIKSPVYEKEQESGEPDTESPISDWRYSLRYSEFVALNTHMIQQLMKRVERLEGERL